MKAKLIIGAAIAAAPVWVPAADVGKANQPTQIAPAEISIKKPTANTPAVQQLQKPQVDVKQATQKPRNLPKVEPTEVKQSSAPSKPVDEPRVRGGETIAKPPATDLGNARGIKDADQGRGAIDMQGAMDAARAVPGGPKPGEDINPRLGLGGDAGRRLSELPGHETGAGFEDPTGRIPGVGGNQDKGGAAGSPVRSSANPADWIGGAASQGPGSGTRLSTSITQGGASDWHYDGLPRRDSQGRTHLRRDDGAIRILTPNPQGGSPSVFEKSPSGEGGFTIYRYHHQDGNVVTSEDVYNSSGERIGGSKTVNGVEVQDRPQTGDKSQVEGSTQDPDNADADGSWARWHAKIMGQNPDLNLQNPDRVNRGAEGGTSTQQAPRLRIPEEQLVVNPDPNNAGSPNRVPDDGYAERLREHVEEGSTGGGGPK